MHLPPTHVSSKSALFAASLSSGISLRFLGKAHCSCLGFSALGGGGRPGADLHQEANPSEVKVQKIHPIDHAFSAGEHECAIICI